MAKLKELIAIANENRHKFIKAIGARYVAGGQTENSHTYTLLIHPDDIPWDELKNDYDAFCFGYRCSLCPHENFRFCLHNKLRSTTGEDIRREQLKDAVPALSMHLSKTKAPSRKHTASVELAEVVKPVKPVEPVEIVATFEPVEVVATLKPLESLVATFEPVVTQRKGRSRSTFLVTVELTQLAITRYDQGELLTVICKDLNVNPNEMSQTMKDLGVVIRKGKRN